MTEEDEQQGRKGKPAHQRLVTMAARRLLDEVIGDDWLSATFVRENPMDVRTQTDISGERFGSIKVAMAELRMYCDIACAVVYDEGARALSRSAQPTKELLDRAKVLKDAGLEEKYREAIKAAYGMCTYIVECEINPRSNLLRDGPRLTAYRLIKQQNNNLTLILAVYEGTKVDNPGIFDHIWEFPHAHQEADK